MITFRELTIAAVILAGGLAMLVTYYRQQHCVELFGHWIAIDQPTTLLCTALR